MYITISKSMYTTLQVVVFIFHKSVPERIAIYIILIHRVHTFDPWQCH